MFDINQIDLPKEIKVAEQITGKERGSDIKYLYNYTIREYGRSGFQKLKTELEHCGYKLPEIMIFKDVNWIPASLPTIYMIAMVKIFAMSEKDIVKMGKNIIKLSRSAKIFMKYFLSPEKTVRFAAKRWNLLYSFGQVEIVDWNNKEKLFHFRLENFKKHPITCIYMRGLVAAFIEMAIGSNNINVVETKCMFRGDPYHEYRVSW